VRLDHLLSKEHLASALGPASKATSWALDPRWFAHGWNIDQLAERRSGLRKYSHASGVERAAAPVIDLGTLLGPEGTGARSSLGSLPARTRPGRGMDRVRAERPRTIEARGEPGHGTARTLRTAQWTRASLWPS
jgi:hypothetical protein